MMDFGRYRNALSEALWNADLASLPPLRRWIRWFLRVIHVLGRDLTEGQLTLQAMGLVYTTLLSLVPLLAVSFSVLKAFGVHNAIRPLLLHFLAPLGDNSGVISAHIIGFVEHIKVGVLGALGLGLLIYTVASLVQKVERAFNYTWQVEQARPLIQRFSQYLSVLTVGPVLVFSAMGLTATLMNASVVKQLAQTEPLGMALRTIGAIAPYALVIAAFTFAYVFIPNTRVHLRSAITGGIIAGTVWEAGGWLFASFVAGSTRYSAIYSGFAILVMFMIWLYLSWLILLAGASIAFYHQHPESLTPHRRPLRLSARQQEQLALVLMTWIVRNHYGSGPACSRDTLVQQAGIPETLVTATLGLLEQRGLVVRSAGEPEYYLPAKSPETVPLRTLIEAVRSAGDDRAPLDHRFPSEPYVDRVIHGMDRALDDSLGGRTLKDLALAVADVSTVRSAPGSQALPR